MEALVGSDVWNMKRPVTEMAQLTAIEGYVCRRSIGSGTTEPRIPEPFVPELLGVLELAIIVPELTSATLVQSSITLPTSLLIEIETAETTRIAKLTSDRIHPSCPLTKAREEDNS